MFITILFAITLLLITCGGEAEKHTNDDHMKGSQSTVDQENAKENNDVDEEELGSDDNDFNDISSK